MKSKTKLLINYFILSLIIIISFTILSTYEYHKYTINFNNKLSSIISLIKEEYPNINDEDIVKILNSKSSPLSNNLKRYGIDITNDSLILENNNLQKKYIITNTIFLIICITIIILLFLKYNKNKDKEINNITKYIEELNNKNYSLKLDEFTEEDLSILKSEIYKTTVMLKEQASNSLNDKINLKKSLEDISHQLKTPLTSILITTNNLIDDNNMTDELKIEFLKDIRREIMKINFLIQSLLKLSKFDSNTISYINKPVKVKNIINKSIKNVSAICDLHNINIEVTSHDDTTIICDEMWQIEAITNIIKNCLEHSKDDSKLTIFYEDNNVYTKIVIKDYGEGIPKKDIHHIFERFYKGANSNKDSIGIGLSLSKSIIEKNNGTISVKSNENKGTEFTIKYFK